MIGYYNTQEAAALLTFAFSSTLEGVVTSFTQGTFSEEQFGTARAAARVGVATLISYFRKAMEQQYRPT